MSNKASQQYWNREYASFKLHIAKKKDVIRRWIESHIPPVVSGNKTCLEIGCYPGRFISVFGELGYELFGIDRVDQLDALPRWLKQSGYKVGSFWKEDFNAFNPHRKFDIVCSFGFVEHFTNWQEVLKKHAALVSDSGYLLVEAPNFVGTFQNWLHANFDKENYARHHIPAMEVEAWVELLEAWGFEIVYQGCFGRFHFWTEQETRTLYQRLVLRCLKIFKPLIRILVPPHRKSYSPFCGVVARKP